MFCLISISTFSLLFHLSFHRFSGESRQRESRRGLHERTRPRFAVGQGQLEPRPRRLGSDQLRQDDRRRRDGHTAADDLWCYRGGYEGRHRRIKEKKGPLSEIRVYKTIYHNCPVFDVMMSSVSNDSNVHNPGRQY